MSNALSSLRPKVIDDLVRVGNRGDGGYVLPKSVLVSADALLSLGLDSDWTFDAQLLELNPTLLVHAYDIKIGNKYFTAKIFDEMLKVFQGRSSVRNVKGRVDILRYYNRFFRTNENVRHFQQRVFNRKDDVNDVTIPEIMSRMEGRNNIIVKMDIEGGEYRVASDLIKFQSRIPLLAIEFHDTEPFRETFLATVRAFSTAYDIVHLHGNNYGGVASDGLSDVLEITLLHKKLCRATELRKRLPLPGLDFPNNSAKKDHEFAFG